MGSKPITKADTLVHMIDKKKMLNNTGPFW